MAAISSFAFTYRYSFTDGNAVGSGTETDRVSSRVDRSNVWSYSTGNASGYTEFDSTMPTYSSMADWHVERQVVDELRQLLVAGLRVGLPLSALGLVLLLGLRELRLSRSCSARGVFLQRPVVLRGALGDVRLVAS